MRLLAQGSSGFCSNVPVGILDGLLGKSPLKLVRTADGPRLTDPRTGVSFIAPTEGAEIPAFPESPVSPAFDGGFRLSPYPVEVRLRLVTVTSQPGAPPPEPGAPLPPPPKAGPPLAYDLCLHHADARTDGDPLAGVAQAWQLEEWRVDGAASSIYPLAKPEGAFDMEECHVLVKGSPARATILMKLFSTKGVSPPLWAELNGRMNATLAWGGTPRSPVSATDSFFVDASMKLLPEARSEASRLADELKKAGVEAKAVAEVAANVLRFAYGTDPPDAVLDAEVRGLIPEALLQPIASAPLKQAVTKAFEGRVKTYRDFRGFHVFLEETARAMGWSSQGS
ncbi:hypothetical protein HY251_22050 [bacterium]|nr:hypothetical protein [bacterium]